MSQAPTTDPQPRTPALAARLAQLSDSDGPDAYLDHFLDWVIELGFDLFPAQEEALLELMADRHVILNTPTGSGKSLVAAGQHWKTLAEGGTSFYTAPIKALVSEKFFALCDTFGADKVGMLTGDASINADAPILCCTAEVLSNMALRHGGDLRADSVVMDEFHYYGDRDRGVAWQIPLITLSRTQFLLMSATLGNPAPIAERLDHDTTRTTATVKSAERPVPLEFEYLETPIHETVETLHDKGRAPIYIVSFTQRECAELAGALTSLQITTREERMAIREAIGDFRFDTAYGKEMKRYLSFGLGIHHAGLLPKYRLLVERLAQQGLLKAVCGTDTLGVGVNIPLRTVVFQKLCKYDGEKVGILAVRDFQQISGRAGRKGFDDQGWVVCQAPEHEIENKRLAMKVAGDPKKAKKLRKKKPPTRGYVHWDQATFERLVSGNPETLESRFHLSHGMILDLIQRDADRDDPNASNFAAIRKLLADCHEPPEKKAELLSEAALRVRSLGRAGILRMTRDTQNNYLWVTVDPDLQIDFSLHRGLSLFLVELVERLDPEAPDYGLRLLSFTEAILEDPRVVLYRQIDKQKDELVARMKAEGIDYDERMAKLEEVTHPKPEAEFLYGAYSAFRNIHPWLGEDNVRPKSIGREMFEGYMSFEDFIRHYGLQRSEGVVLRYLSQLYKALTQNIPDELKTEEVYDVLGFFRAMLTRVDTSLLEEWENMLDPERGLSKRAGTEAGEQEIEHYELLHDPRALRARIRAEVHQLVRALAARDWEEAERLVRPADPERPDERGSLGRQAIEEAIAPYFESYDHIDFTPRAREAKWTRVEEPEPRFYRVTQVLVDPEDDNFWYLEGIVDLRDRQRIDPDQPLFMLTGIRS